MTMEQGEKEVELRATVFKNYPRYDYNDGRGVRMKQLAGVMVRNQMGPDMGIPIFVPTFTYDTPSNSLVGIIDTEHAAGLATTDSDVGAATPPALILIQIPAGLPRTEDALSIELVDKTLAELTTMSLVDYDGSAIDGADLAPGSIVQALWTTAALTVVGQLFRRPQDSTIKMAISLDQTLDALEIAAGTTSITGHIVSPTWTSGEYYLFLGYPEGEDPFINITQGGIDQFSFWDVVVGAIDGYNWYIGQGAQNEFGSGLTYGVER